MEQDNQQVHRIDPRDNVAVALRDLAAGTPIVCGNQEIPLAQNIPFGHKVALSAIPQGAPVIKYGEQIGLASQDIAPGEHVHVHNLESTRGRGDLAQAQHL